VSAVVPTRGTFTIGEVLAQLQADFPDVTISKIRFLESEGLVEPQRTASGYRKFSPADVARLRYVLSAQRDQYLPLRVIKQHLDALDRGLEPPGPGGGGPRVPRALVAAEGLPGPEAFAPATSEVRLSRRELTEAAALDEGLLDQLEQFGLVVPLAGATRSGTSHSGTTHSGAAPYSGAAYYDGNALLVATTVAQMARFGIEPRHLRAFRAAADREVGLIEQVIIPLMRQRNPDARARAAEVVRELAALSVRLHAALVRAGLQPGLPH
jgi:DNA-binding transcriptional MerR regulator